MHSNQLFDQEKIFDREVLISFVSYVGEMLLISGD